MNESVYKPSDDKSSPTKKAKEEDEIRNYYNIQKAPRVNHSVIHVGQQFHKSKGLYYIVYGMKFQTVPTYIWNLAYIRHQMNLDDWSTYIFDKPYEFDTADFAFEALSRI